jgi:2',3'-cyclic-nucleotide 2'-phosphodiesterase (5'-nucleotidase family)
MEFMNAIGYDAMALGNHEFDLGRDNCLGLIGLAKFPVLSANLVDRKTDKLFAPAGDVILERGGVRIAVIGLILDELHLVVAAEPIRDLEVRPGIEVAREEVERLDPQSDLIVVVMHWGLDESRALARAVPGIDVIVTGHDHKRTEKPIVEKGVLIVEAGSRLDRLGRLDIKVAGDRVIEHRYQLLDLPAAAASEAPAPVAELYHEIETTIDAEYGEVVGKLATPWVRDSHGESNLGNWVTDRMREAAGADFAVTNSSGLRTDVGAGPLTRRDIYSISPFPNVLVTFKATGQQLLAFARKNARDALGMDKSIVQVSGLSYSYDPNGNVYDLKVGGQPVEPDRSYLGATTDYLLYSQANKYLGFVPADPVTDGRSIFDILCEGAARMSPISTRVDGRMHALDAPPPRGGDCAPESGRGELPPALLPPLHTLDPAALDRLLADLPDRLPRFDDRLRALALARLGAPYALGTLGEANSDDPDPVFRADEADCTVLVLTTVALAHARSTEEAERWMGPANYRRQGDSYPVSYKNRLHFTSDRIKSSPLFADITAEVAEPGERKTAHVVLNRQESGKELLPLDWERELDQTYVPAKELRSVLDNAPALCGVAFVRLSSIPRGFLVAHEGFLLDGRCLLHASSEAGRVALVDFLDYVLKPRDSDGTSKGRPRFDGVIFYALREGASLHP